jgi:hypothetical protein
MNSSNLEFTGYYDKLNNKIHLGNILLRDNGSIYEVIKIGNEACLKKLNDDICPEIRLDSDIIDNIWDDLIIIN